MHISSRCNAMLHIQKLQNSLEKPSWVQGTVRQGNTLNCSVLHCILVSYIVVQRGAVQCSGERLSTIECSGDSWGFPGARVRQLWKGGEELTADSCAYWQLSIVTSWQLFIGKASIGKSWQLKTVNIDSCQYRRDEADSCEDWQLSIWKSWQLLTVHS